MKFNKDAVVKILNNQTKAQLVDASMYSIKVVSVIPDIFELVPSRLKRNAESEFIGLFYTIFYQDILFEINKMYSRSIIEKESEDKITEVIDSIFWEGIAFSFFTDIADFQSLVNEYNEARSADNFALVYCTRINKRTRRNIKEIANLIVLIWNAKILDREF